MQQHPRNRWLRSAAAGLALIFGAVLSSALLAQTETAAPPAETEVTDPASPATETETSEAETPAPDVQVNQPLTPETDVAEPEASSTPEVEPETEATTPVDPATAIPDQPVTDPDGAAEPEPAPEPETAVSAPADTGQTALDEIENSITLTKERVEELKREIAELAGDRAKQNAALIAAGQRVKLAEIEVSDVEERLDALILAEIEVRGRLDDADGQISNILAALERISLNPPPAMIVDPSDALGSARSAILISAILPQINAKAAEVTADLTRLTAIKAAALEEEALLKANFAVLEEEQLRIATLILARRQGVEVMTAELAAEEQEATELAARASSLKELVASLSARVTAVADAAAAPDTAPTDTPANPSPDYIQVALANTSRVEPALPFAQIKGYLTLPTSGVNVSDYGASDGFGGISQGISIVTRAEAQVVAPADGWVMYKGPYLNYGQIIILNAGENYTILLAGLETVTVDFGQFVLMGEPVGAMGSRTIGQTVTTSAGNSRPTLYIEMRKDNEPVDPTGWWATQPLTQSG
jgi:septal ring factor EnvC (AmiA/AmiB activator)